MSIELETERLRGSVIVRPKGALGTCGWHPQAWTAAMMRRGETPKAAFLRVNPNWASEEDAA